ncbi:9294_t:CDS:2, partial [Gigaspora margarita]
FGKILWNLNLDKIEQKVNLLKKSKNLPHSNLIEGLSQVIPVLDTFLNTSSQSSKCDDFCIIVYNAVYLDNEDQVSESTDSVWYGKILLFLRLFQGLLKEPYDLAIVHWYDILSEESELYGCLQVYYSEEYNVIPIGSIIQE